MGYTLRLTGQRAEALRQRAEQEGRTVDEVVQDAIGRYVDGSSPRSVPKRSVPAEEFLAAFAGLPFIDLERFRADQDRCIDKYAHFDAFERAYGRPLPDDADTD